MSQTRDVRRGTREISITSPVSRPSSAALATWDRRYVWHPFTQQAEWASRDPIIIESGRGVWLNFFTMQTASLPWETWTVLPACWLLLIGLGCRGAEGTEAVPSATETLVAG